ncbi:MAG: hypothetical protein GY820_42085 [Gammaproteobacteria bacterium]|nr:hypothetical protein [Gammaproteobacteria bacterium]
MDFYHLWVVRWIFSTTGWFGGFFYQHWVGLLDFYHHWVGLVDFYQHWFGLLDFTFRLPSLYILMGINHVLNN